MADHKKLSKGERIIRRERRERITLMTHSLLTAKYQARYHRVGIRQLMNRLLSMIQEHTIIVVLDQKKGQKDYRIIFHTMHDPVWKNVFEKTLASAGQIRGDHVYWDNVYVSNSDEKKQKGKYNAIWRVYSPEDESEETAKFFAFYQMDFKKEQAYSYAPPNFKLFSKAKIERLLIGEFLSEFSNPDSPLISFYDSEDLNKKFSKRAEKWKEGIYDIPLRNFDIQYDDLEYSRFILDPDQKSENWLTDFYDQRFEKFRDIFEKQYLRIKKSPLLKNEGSQTPNIIFSIRQFSSDHKRYCGATGNDAHYRYDVRTIIPKEQKKDLRDAFKNLKREGVINVFDEDGDESFFWDVIENKHNKNEVEWNLEIDGIIEEMQAPTGLNSRSLSDMSFSGGFVKMTINPYSYKGTNRLDQGWWENSQKEEKVGRENQQYRWLCYNHYLCHVLSPNSESTSALITPGHVAGSPWFTMIFLYDNSLEPHKKWQRGYHYYHSIYTYLLPGIRKALKRLYFEDFEEVISKVLRYTREWKAVKNQFSCCGPVDFIQRTMNHCSALLARIYPFPVVLILDKDITKEKASEYARSIFPNTDIDVDLKYTVEWTKGFNFSLALVENPYFISNITDHDDFVTGAEIQDVIDRARSLYSSIRKNSANVNQTKHTAEIIQIKKFRDKDDD